VGDGGCDVVEGPRPTGSSHAEPPVLYVPSSKAAGCYGGGKAAHQALGVAEAPKAPVDQDYDWEGARPVPREPQVRHLAVVRAVAMSLALKGCGRRCKEGRQFGQCLGFRQVQGRAAAPGARQMATACARFARGRPRERRGRRSGPINFDRARHRNKSVTFRFSTYKERSERLRWDDLALASFTSRPLPEDVLRCLRYMHDVEFHTVCYLRDLLLSPAHAEPEVTGFLSLWACEEFWHGEAIAHVLRAHGEQAGEARVAEARASLGARDRLRPLVAMLGGWLAGPDFTALHMAWGAVNEWSTQAGYSLLGRKSGHPVLQQLLARLVKQEGRHIDFYAAEARRRLASSRRAQLLTRASLTLLWGPVGSGVMPRSETSFVINYLMSDSAGIAAAQRADANISRLPGLGGLRLLEGAVRAYSRR